MINSHQIVGGSQKQQYAGAGEYATAPSAASDILLMAERLAVRASELAEAVNGKLYPVMADACPTTSKCEDVGRIYPPMFSELRGKFYTISAALDSIQDAISRTEL